MKNIVEFEKAFRNQKIIGEFELPPMNKYVLDTEFKNTLFKGKIKGGSFSGSVFQNCQFIDFCFEDSCLEHCRFENCFFCNFTIKANTLWQAKQKS